MPRKWRLRKKPTALWPSHRASWRPARPKYSRSSLSRAGHRHRQIVDDVQHADGDDEKARQTSCHRQCGSRRRAACRRIPPRRWSATHPRTIPASRFWMPTAAGGSVRHHEQLISPGRLGAARCAARHRRLAINALPPKVKHHADVCSGRKRPKIVHFEIEVERREGELPGDNVADQEPGEPHNTVAITAGADDAVGVAGFLRWAGHCLSWSSAMAEPMRPCDAGWSCGP